jgi:hypothetical protein
MSGWKLVSFFWTYTEATLTAFDGKHIFQLFVSLKERPSGTITLHKTQTRRMCAMRVTRSACLRSLKETWVSELFFFVYKRAPWLSVLWHTFCISLARMSHFTLLLQHGRRWEPANRNATFTWPPPHKPFRPHLLTSFWVHFDSRTRLLTFALLSSAPSAEGSIKASGEGGGTFDTHS